MSALPFLEHRLPLCAETR